MDKLSGGTVSVHWASPESRTKVASGPEDLGEGQTIGR